MFLKKILFIFFWLLDYSFISKKKGWVFHGYTGLPIGNNLALFKSVLQNDKRLAPFFWTGKVAPNIPEACKFFKKIPRREESILEHVRYLLFLLRFKVISVESPADLNDYFQFLPQKRRVIVLLPHGFTLKTSGITAPHLSPKQKRVWSKVGKEFDLISASSRLESYMISATVNCPINNVVVMGQQRKIANKVWTKKEKLDAKKIFETAYSKLLHDNKLVVYAPTHRDHEINSSRPCLFGFKNLEILNRELIKNKSLLLIREHAIASEKEQVDYSNIIYSPSGPTIEFSHICPAVNLLITDYSGIFVDWLASDVRFAFWQYDIESYRDKRGFWIPEEIFSVGAKIKTPSDFIELVSSNTKSVDEKQSSRFWKNILYENTQNEALTKTADEIYKKTKEKRLI